MLAKIINLILKKNQKNYQLALFFEGWSISVDYINDSKNLSSTNECLLPVSLDSLITVT